MKYIIGIDEVGRGPLAGPVTVGIVMCEEKLYTKIKRDKNLPALGKDSKKLSPELREKYSKYLKHIGVPYVVLHTSNKQIDKVGIAKCIRKSIEKGLENLIIENSLKIGHSYLMSDSELDKKKYSCGDNCKLKIVLDGGLKISEEFIRKYPQIKFSQSTIIKGDEKEKIIAWASILAKVSRDELMRKAHKKHPKYGFHKHKGYGTVFHRVAISSFGLSVFHRKTYCRNISISKHLSL